MNIPMSLALIVATSIIFYYRVLKYGYVIDDIPVKAQKRALDEVRFRNRGFNPKDNHFPLITGKLIECGYIDKNFIVTKKEPVLTDDFKKSLPNYNEDVFNIIANMLLEASGEKWTLQNRLNQLTGSGHYQPALEHGYNIALHTLVCCFIYFAFGHNTLSLLAALLFCLNPSNNQGSIWLSGKPYVYSTALLLLGVIFKEIFPLTYVLAVDTFSINGYLAPFLFIFLSPHYWIFSLLFIAPIAYKRLNPILGPRAKQTKTEANQIYLKRLVIVFKTYAYYFLMGLLPIRLGMFHSFLSKYILSKKDNDYYEKMTPLFYAGVAIATCVVSLVIFSPHSQITFGLFWFTIFIAQWCNLLFVNHGIAERYLYLANVGLMWALINVLALLPFSCILITAFLVYYATRLINFMPCFKNNGDYFHSNIENFPGAALAFNEFGLYNLFKKRIGTAYDYMMDGLKVRPEDFKLNFNVAGIHMEFSNYNDTLRHLEIAERDLLKNSYNQIWFDTIAQMRKTCLDILKSREPKQEVPIVDVQGHPDGS